MSKEYKVTIDLNSLRFSLIAESEEEAISKAYDIAIDNYTSDLLRHADYLVEEVEAWE